MVAALMSQQLHERGIHAVWTGATQGGGASIAADR
jgi:hypothetical protein